MAFNVSLPLFFLIFFLLLMEILRVGSINVNGMRDGRKISLLSEIIRLKDLSVVFLQETHSNQNNEADWGL